MIGIFASYILMNWNQNQYVDTVIVQGVEGIEETIDALGAGFSDVINKSSLTFQLSMPRDWKRYDPDSKNLKWGFFLRGETRVSILVATKEDYAKQFEPYILVHKILDDKNSREYERLPRLFWINEKGLRIAFYTNSNEDSPVYNVVGFYHALDEVYMLVSHAKNIQEFEIFRDVLASCRLKK